MLVTVHNNVDQTFWIFYFLCVFGFLTQKQIQIDKKKNVKTFKANANKQNMQYKKSTKQSVPYNREIKSS